MNKDSEEYEKGQKLAKETLDNIMANIPTSTSVDFGTKTITETFGDGRITKRQISEDNPEYTFEVKTSYETDDK